MRGLLLLFVGLVVGILVGLQLAPRQGPPRWEKVGDGAVEGRSGSPRPPPDSPTSDRTNRSTEADETPASPTSQTEESKTGILVTVLEPSGEIASKARIQINGNGRTWTPEQRFLKRPPGFASVEASKPRRIRSQRELVRVPAVGGPVGVVLRLAKSDLPEIVGRVRLPPGLWAGFDVRVDQTGPGRADTQNRGFTADNEPTFWFGLPGAGTYVVKASYRNCRPEIAVSKSVRVVDGTTSVELALPDLPLPGQTTVRVVRPNGAVVKDAPPRVGWYAGGDFCISRPIAQLADGTWIVSDVPPHADADAPLLAEFQNWRGSFALAPWKPGGTIVLEEPGALIVRVLDYDDSIHVGLLLEREWIPGLGSVESGTLGRLSHDGRLGWDTLAPGTYTLIVWTSRKREPGNWPIEAREVRIESGRDTTIEVKVETPPVHSLSFDVAEGRTVRLERVFPGDRGGHELKGRVGVQRVEGLPAGRYELRDKDKRIVAQIEVPHDGGVIRVP